MKSTVSMPATDATSYPVVGADFRREVDLKQANAVRAWSGPANRESGRRDFGRIGLPIKDHSA